MSDRHRLTPATEDPHSTPAQRSVRTLWSLVFLALALNAVLSVTGFGLASAAAGVVAVGAGAALAARHVQRSS